MEKNSIDLVSHLATNIYFLKASSNSYDNGFKDEVVRIATSLRVLFHDTKKSTSLLKYIGLKNISLVDSKSPYNPKNLIHQDMYHGLVIHKITLNKGAEYVPALENGAFNEERINNFVDFNSWWNICIIRSKNKEYSRKNIILNLANKDGGAHVDKTIDSDFYELTRSNYYEWKYKDEVVGTLNIEGDPVEASVRQMAYEVLRSFTLAFNSNVEMMDKNMLRKSIAKLIYSKSKNGSQRNNKCLCGSNLKSKNCCL